MNAMSSMRRPTTATVTLIATLVTIGLVVALGGCGTDQNTGSLAAEDTVVLGETTAVVGSDPEMLADGTSASGTGIEGSEEDQAQQDRISGGANAGSVVSNITMDDGITAASESSATADDLLALNAGEAPAITINDAAMATMPQSHVDAGLTIDLCTVCHTSN